MELLEFPDVSALQDWILRLQEKFISIEGDYVVFTLITHDDKKVEKAIDYLLSEFASFEQTKEGKKI